MVGAVPGRRVGQAGLNQPPVERREHRQPVADGVDRTDLALEPAQIQLHMRAFDLQGVELVGGAPREPTVQLLQVGGPGVGVAIPGQERTGQTAQTKLSRRIQHRHGDITHDKAPGRDTHVHGHGQDQRNTARRAPATRSS